MFEVTLLNECPSTGITSYEMKWSTGTAMRQDHGSFLSRSDAEYYIASSKRSYILIMFDNFVYQAGINFEIGGSDYYLNETRLAAFQRCKKYTEWFEAKDLPTIVKVVQALQEDLRRILPKPADQSFSKLESKIVDMILFCKEELSTPR